MLHLFTLIKTNFDRYKGLPEEVVLEEGSCVSQDDVTNEEEVEEVCFCFFIIPGFLKHFFSKSPL